MRILKASLLVGALMIVNFNFTLLQHLPTEKGDLSPQEVSHLEKQQITELQQQLKELKLTMEIRDFLDQYSEELHLKDRKEIAQTILEASKRYEVEPELIIAVIETESAFRKSAISHKGAMGLMQILPSTGFALARELNVDFQVDNLLNDPLLNILMGTYYLKKLLQQFGDLNLALTAYNMGPGKLMELASRNISLPQEYPTKVDQYRQRIDIEQD